MLVAPIVEQFWTRYPNVKLSFIEAGSAELAQQVLRSELDMYMGVRNNYSPKLTHELLLKEDLYLVIPDTLLKQKFPQDYRERLAEFSMGVDIAQFQGIPFSMAAPGSFLRSQIDDFLSQEQVELDMSAFNAFTRNFVFSLPFIMSKYIMLGLDLNTIYRCTILNPARCLGYDKDFGSLLPGTTANIAVHRLIDKATRFEDAFGMTRMGQQILRTETTICQGTIVFRTIDV